MRASTVGCRVLDRCGDSSTKYALHPIREVSAGYDADLPFHNFHHSVSVLQGCYAMLMQSEELASALTPMDRLALCAAWLGLWGGV